LRAGCCKRRRNQSSGMCRIRMRDLDRWWSKAAGSGLCHTEFTVIARAALYWKDTPPPSRPDRRSQDGSRNWGAA